MSASSPPMSALPSAGDPSMDDILASIRRILNEDEVAAANGSAPPPPPPIVEEPVLMLDQSMMVASPKPDFDMPEVRMAMPPRERAPASIMGSEAEAAAAASVGSLIRTLSADRATATHNGGPTIEDLVREAIRPLLKGWLDAYLPPMVERMVRAELTRISAQAAL